MNKIGALGIIAIAVVVVFVLAAVAVTVEGASSKAKAAPAKKNVKPISQPIKQVKIAPALAAACADTDGDYNTGLRGTCTDAGGTQHTDFCQANGHLSEFTCNPTDSKNQNGSSTICGSYDVSCEALGKSCVNGACV